MSERVVDRGNQRDGAVDAAAVAAALDTVDDPEYPGVSIAALGLVADVRIDDGRVDIDLVPTVSGCPALRIIAADVEASVGTVAGVDGVSVRFVDDPVWTPERIAPAARQRIARDFTVAVALTAAPATCPRCGGELVLESMFGPTRCRDVRRCVTCDEWIETIR